MKIELETIRELIMDRYCNECVNYGGDACFECDVEPLNDGNVELTHFVDAEDMKYYQEDQEVYRFSNK
jgi:hypothetical protein